MNIYVGNLPYEVNDQDLKDIFAPFGEVDSARVVMDRDTGRAKGFGFVEMKDSEQAQAAIKGLNGKDLKGRPMTVNESKPREGGRPQGGGGAGRGSFGGGGGGGGKRW